MTNPNIEKGFSKNRTLSNQLRKQGKSSVVEYFYKKEFTKINPIMTHVEAFIHSSEKICAIQWHPEDLFRRADPFLRGDFVTHQMIMWLLDNEGANVQKKIHTTPVKTFETI